MSLVDCNDELLESLGKRMTNEDFIDKYNDTIESITQDSLNDMNIEDASTDQWNEEYEIQKVKLMDDNKIVIVD